jgi:ATP diphosphatase
MADSPRKSLADLLAVMAALRTPGTGCPWDLAQTFATIAPYTIEEAYEVADAIVRDDMAGLKDELGDLLLQVTYHARLAEEQGAFTFADVVDAITRKMLRRHPHVFGSAAQRAAGAAPGFWERIKAEEKAAKAPSPRLREEGRGEGPPQTAAQVPAPHPNPLPVPEEAWGEGMSPPTPNPSPPGGGRESVLDGIPLALPALTRALKLQAKAARVGFDWPSLVPVFDKLEEELRELEEAVTAGNGEPDTDKIGEELGDVLFVLANVARHLKIDPEAALRATNQKFIRRFHRIEERLAADGRTPGQSSLTEMDRLWDEAKAEERG